MSILTNKNNSFQSCIEACNKCAQACYECFNDCLNEQDVNERKNIVHMLIECAKICQLSSALMSMNSQFSIEQCKICAEICDICVEECDIFKNEHCEKCADICRICSSECKKMFNM